MFDRDMYMAYTSCTATLGLSDKPNGYILQRRHSGWGQRSTTVYA